MSRWKQPHPPFPPQGMVGSGAMAVLLGVSRRMRKLRVNPIVSGGGAHNHPTNPTAKMENLVEKIYTVFYSCTSRDPHHATVSDLRSEMLHSAALGPCVGACARGKRAANIKVTQDRLFHAQEMAASHEAPEDVYLWYRMQVDDVEEVTAERIAALGLNGGLTQFFDSKAHQLGTQWNAMTRDTFAHKCRHLIMSYSTEVYPAPQDIAERARLAGVLSMTMSLIVKRCPHHAASNSQ